MPTKAGKNTRPDLRPWTFKNIESGAVNTMGLYLYPELDCSAMLDDHLDEGGEEQVLEYLHYLRRNKPQWLDEDRVPIYWSVMPCHETAPFQHSYLHRALNGETATPGNDGEGCVYDFLSYFTWPTDPKTGEYLDWFSMTVINDRFPAFARALGWTPSPLQDYCPFSSIMESKMQYYECLKLDERYRGSSRFKVRGVRHCVEEG